MKPSQLVKARILIGEFLAYMSLEHIDEPEHWTHAYRPLAYAMLYVSSTSYPDSTIASHMKDVFSCEE